MFRYGNTGRRIKPPRDDSDEDEFFDPNRRPLASKYTQSASNASIAEAPEKLVRRTLDGSKVRASDFKTKEDYGSSYRDRLVPRQSWASSSSSSQHSSRIEVPPNRTRGEPERRASVQSSPGHGIVGDNYSFRGPPDRRTTETYDQSYEQYVKQQTPISTQNYGHLPSPRSVVSNSPVSSEDVNFRSGAGRAQSQADGYFKQQEDIIRQYQPDRQNAEHQHHSPQSYTQQPVYSRREGSISPLDQNNASYPNTQNNQEYSSEPSAYGGQDTRFDYGTSAIDGRMQQLGLGSRDRAEQDDRSWKPEGRNEGVSQSYPKTLPRFMNRSPTASLRSEHIPEQARDQTRQYGYTEQDSSTLSSVRNSVSSEMNPFQNEASIWQDGHASTNMLHRRILKLDTQCENSNWVSAQLVNDLGAVTKIMKYPQSFRTADGNIMQATLETTLTFRFDRQAASPQTRFFVASAADFSFDIILGWEDARRYQYLALPTFYAIAHRIQNQDGRMIEDQRVAAHEKERQEATRRNEQAKEEDKKRRKSSNKNNHGEPSRRHRREEDREYDSSSRKR